MNCTSICAQMSLPRMTVFSANAVDFAYFDADLHESASFFCRLSPIYAIDVLPLYLYNK